MFGADGEGSVELLGRDNRGKLMRQGDAAEGEQQIGARSRCG